MKNLISLVTALVLCVGTFTALRADDKAEPAKVEKAEKAEKADKADAGEKKAGGGAGTVTCKSGKEERTITTTKPEGGGCQVMYKKGGEEKSVADAKNDAGYCDKVVEKMKTNLTGAGFTCE